MKSIAAVLLGALIGGGMGYLLSVKDGGTHRAEGMLRLLEVAPTGGTGSESALGQQAGTPPAAQRQTRQRLYARAGEVQSEPVIRSAVRNGGLTRLRPFQGKSQDDVVNELLFTASLQSEIIEVSGNSAVVVLGYSAADPESARVVVQAVMDSFRARCGTSNNLATRPMAGGPVEKELADVGEALGQLDALEDRYADLLREQSLRGDAAMRAMEERHLAQLQTEQQTYQQEIAALKQRLRDLRQNPPVADEAAGADAATARELDQRVKQYEKRLQIVEAEIAEQVERLRKGWSQEEAIEQLEQEIAAQRRVYESLVAGPAGAQGSGPSRAVNSESVDTDDPGIQCVQLQAATVLLDRDGAVHPLIYRGGAIGMAAAVVLAIVKTLLLRPRYRF